jgi:predicted metalloprotease
MEWENREESSNVEDDRGSGGGFGGRTGLAIGGGVGGVIIIILGLIFGVDLRPFLGGGPGPGGGVVQPNDGPPRQADAEEEKMAHFSKIVFKDTEIVWDKLFKQMGKTYRKPTLHLYTNEVSSGCGSASASVGPFYCSADEKVYIDLSFYRDMVKKLNSPGEFARAYVLAHEVGHHVQHLLGYSKRAKDAANADPHEMSVRLELQADFFAGVWAHHADQEFHYLQKGDIESAMNTAQQIGDDRLQKKARGTVRPETFTHGTSEQRMKWFREGFKTGDVNEASKLFSLKYKEL